jgi:hypothetical protein
MGILVVGYIYVMMKSHVCAECNAMCETNAKVTGEMGHRWERQGEQCASRGQDMQTIQSGRVKESTEAIYKS